MSSPAGKKHTETHWALIGFWDVKGEARPFFYYGTFATRREAIDDATARNGKSWAQLRRRGERVVKATITTEIPR